MEQFHGTTIVSVRRGAQVALGGDGQVTLGNIVVKASGVGRTHGRFGMDEMVRVKYVDTDRLPGMKKVWWHGYGESFRRQMEGFLDMQFARGLGAPDAVRAVGAATGRNPLCIFIPCHRVIGANGSLTGYAGGLDRKRWLLDHEAAVAGRRLF